MRVLDFRSPNDFIVELRTKSEGDLVILARTRPGKTLRETTAAVQDRALRGKPSPACEGDVLKVPEFNFDTGHPSFVMSNSHQPDPRATRPLSG